MKSAYLALARVCYWLVVILTTVFAAWLAVRAIPALFANYGVLMIGLAAVVFLILGGGALARRSRGRPLLPEPVNPREWTFVFLMLWTGAFGHFLAGNICLALYQYRYVHPEREVEGGPLGFLSLIACASYLVALLMGEFGIRHDKR